MALPALHKTWQGGSILGGTEFVNVAATGETGVLWAIKNAWINFDTNAWTVIASCNALSFSNVGTDYWTNPGSLQYRNNAFDPHAWIILQQAGINAKFQVKFSLDEILAADPDRSNITISFSPTAGFLAVNGGTDGTLSTAPTASDEVGIDGTDWMNAEGSGAAMMLTCIQSTDGECTRCVASNTVDGRPNMAMGFEVPRSPNPAWTNPCLGYAASADAVFGWTVWQEAEPIKASVQDFGPSDLTVALRITGSMFSSTEVAQMEDDESIKFFVGGLHYDGVGADRAWGTLFDWYWVSRNTSGFHAVDLDTFPLAGNRTFVCVGALVWGWLDDSATDLSYT